MILQLDPDALPSRLLETNFAALDFVWPGFPVKTVGSWVGQGGCGKSFLAMIGGLSIALGRRFGGDTPKRGKVLYLAAEDPLDQLGLRVQNILTYWGVKPGSDELARVDANFHLFALLGQEHDLMRTEDHELVILNQLSNLVAGFGDGGDPLRLIVVDTLRRFHNLDENDGCEMSSLLSVMERMALNFNCGVLFIHHITKNAALNDQADLQQASKGNGCLTDNIRYQSNVVNMTKDESKTLSFDAGKTKIGDGRKYYVRLVTPKNNYGPPLDNQWFRRDAKTGVLDPVNLVPFNKAGDMPRPKPVGAR